MARLSAFAVLLLLAGCLGREEEPSPPTEPAAPPVNAVVEHNFLEGEAAAGEFRIPAGAARYDFAAFLVPPVGENVCSAPQARIVVKDPAGATFADVQGSALATASGGRCPGGKVVQDAALAVGTWTVAFSGQGAAGGRVVVQTAAT